MKLSSAGEGGCKKIRINEKLRLIKKNENLITALSTPNKGSQKGLIMSHSIKTTTLNFPDNEFLVLIFGLLLPSTSRLKKSGSFKKMYVCKCVCFINRNTFEDM